MKYIPIKHHMTCMIGIEAHQHMKATHIVDIVESFCSIIICSL